MEDDTKGAIVDALENSVDTNPLVRDLDTAGSCTGAPVGARLTVDGGCWEQVHPDTLNVYDFTHWSINHKGNELAARGGRPNPITRFAELGSTELVFPSHHMMSR